MLATIVDTLAGDPWTESVVAYCYLNQDTPILEVCHTDIRDLVEQATKLLNMLPSMWAIEICRQTLKS